MRKYLILLLTVFVFLFTSCAPREQVDIYASIYPVYYLVEEITKGTKTVVKQVYPPGADVHEYDPGSSKEILKISKAKILFYIGSGLEGFIEKAKAIFTENKTGLKIVELSQNIPLCKYIPPSLDPDTFDLNNSNFAYVNADDNKYERGIADKHIWLDPLRMLAMAQVICSEVKETDPENAEIYEENFTELRSKLQKLDEAFTQKLSDPNLEKIIIVDHDAYLYWEERYQIRRIRTRIDNESCDINLKDFQNIIAIGGKYNIKNIVVTRHESMCPIIRKKYTKALNADIIELNALATLYRSELKKTDYYIEMMSNLDKLVAILPRINPEEQFS